MHYLSLFFGLLVAVTPSLAAAVPPVNVPIYKYHGRANEGRYIVKVRNGVDKTGIVSAVEDVTGTTVEHDWNAQFFNAFATELDGEALDLVTSNPNVEYVAEDGYMSALDTQTNATWGLARVSSHGKLANQDPSLLNFRYKYKHNPGNGVDIYVVDTGIYVEHWEFEGRARWGGVFCANCTQKDGHGHGTHVAGTAGGKWTGVAKKSNLIAVKVLNDNASGTYADIIAGLEWIYVQYVSNGKRPSIATMSFGGGNSPPVNEAVQKLINAGIHCTVAAGNSNVDAKDTSPANTPGAITVGATDIYDSRAFYSNFGSIVDIFAPGSNVTSTWKDGGYKKGSGTSMATPHVAGLVASFLSTCDNRPTPAEMVQRIKGLSSKNALSNIPEGTANYLAFNGYWG